MKDVSAETAVPTAGTSAPRSLSYNPAENAVLLGNDADSGSYELYIVPRDSKGEASPVSLQFTIEQTPRHPLPSPQPFVLHLLQSPSK